MLNNSKFILMTGLLLMLGGVLLSGCESDAVAPQDETPALSQENAAYQAAMVALALVEVGPQVVNFSSSKTVYTFDFVGYEYVDGEVSIDFRLGGADGTSSTPEMADYAHLWTMGEDGLSVTYDGYDGGAMFMTADIMANINQTTDTATILAGSGGDLIAGVYTGTYDIDGVVVGETGYPTAGTLTFTGGAHTLMVTFNGSATVPVSVDGTETWTLNLSNGELGPYMPPVL